VTPFDLLFILLFLATLATLIAVVGNGIRGRKARALALLRRLVYCSAGYLALVYIATAFWQPAVLHPGDPDCNDDWCIAVAGVKHTADGAAVRYEVALRIFSRARGRAQREGLATDVYLVDSQWRRYDPVRDASDIPLNTLLQPGESKTTRRVFEVPADAKLLGLAVGRSELPVCVIIGECSAFHKGTRIQLF
jgi:hypothetical protein